MVAESEHGAARVAGRELAQRGDLINGLACLDVAGAGKHNFLDAQLAVANAARH